MTESKPACSLGGYVDFALILFILSVVTGILWFYDVLVARKRRPQGSKDPWWVEYGASFFCVIMPIFMLRSFWVEPFRIPSGSMIPTLLVGDFILVNKYAYGVRLPVLNKKVFEVGNPQRGDVMVFRFPLDPSQSFIKRVVGLPGDKVEYLDKRLTINGQELAVQPDGQYLHSDRLYSSDKFSEKLGQVQHAILNDADMPPFVPEMQRKLHGYQDACVYSEQGVSCTVPAGHYFVMGDNRDQSADSRIWGFVPDENIVGRAFYVWFHADGILPPQGISLKRIGSFN